MKTSWINKWYLWTAFSFVVCSASSVIVRTTDGPIEGKTIRLTSGKKVNAFLGVPYAAPPLGRNRFAPPQPLEPWNQTLKTTSLPKSCVQCVPEFARKVVWFVADSEESEDCLYLNLWVPKTSTRVMKPVMIWIHGGGFLAGSSNMPLYDGSILASENDVIVANVNYRMAMFGFLYLNNSDVPGNMGIRDQIQAMTWIRDNAKAFGGDPQRITIFGESAGSVSVNIHLLNPKLDGLFQNAIMESASISTVGIRSTAGVLNTSISLGQTFNCPIDDFNEMLKCLRNKSVAELAGTQMGIPLYGRIVYAPITNGIEVPFDVSVVSQRLTPGKRRNILAGNIPREMNYFFTDFFPDKTLSENVTITEDDMRVLLKNMSGISDRGLQDIFLHEYKSYDGTYNRSQLRVEATDFITDLVMVCPELRDIGHLMNGQNQVFYYYFTHRPSKVGKIPIPEWMGPVHGDDIPFVFGQPLDRKNGYTVAEKSFSRKIMTYWTNFAKTGNPNGKNCRGPRWPVLKPNGNMTYMVLDLKSRLRTFLRERECDFWNEIYPSILQIQDQLNKITLP